MISARTDDTALRVTTRYVPHPSIGLTPAAATLEGNDKAVHEKVAEVAHEGRSVKR
jgi:hypothetical protein